MTSLEFVEAINAEAVGLWKMEQHIDKAGNLKQTRTRDRRAESVSAGTSESGDGAASNPVL
ncbi:MAG: hypothetical protein K1X78_01430 [Verrucomicrobiaceae bacterium]|nr:hypothetical protein [Verrucomicrobiaceae bacterium]